MKRIAVTGTGSLIGQGIIKSIKTSKLIERLEIIGYDYFPSTIGSFWTDKNFLLPDILSDEISEETWLNFLISNFNKEKIEIVFIGIDFELRLFSKYKKQIETETNARIIVSSLKSIKIANDKYLTYKFLKKNNLNFPKTKLLSQCKKADFDFPLIVKSRIGYRSNNVFLVKDFKELENLKIRNKRDYIIQEYLSNNDEEYTCGTLTHSKIYKSIILKRRLLNGNTSIAEHFFDRNQKIEHYIFNVNKLLMPYGPCNYQLRIDKNGNPKIFEINLRYSGTTYIRSLFGFNEIEFIICKELFEVENEFKLNYGKAMRYFEEKLI